MPVAPQRACTGCGRLVRERRCRHCERERQRARPTPAQRGYGANWRMQSKLFLARPENRRCVMCGGPATLVDHIRAPKGNRALFWDQGNWQPACGPCNRRKAIRHEGGFGH